MAGRGAAMRVVQHRGRIAARDRARDRPPAARGTHCSTSILDRCAFVTKCPRPLAALAARSRSKKLATLVHEASVGVPSFAFLCLRRKMCPCASGGMMPQCLCLGALTAAFFRSQACHPQC